MSTVPDQPSDGQRRKQSSATLKRLISHVAAMLEIEVEWLGEDAATVTVAELMDLERTG